MKLFAHDLKLITMTDNLSFHVNAPMDTCKIIRNEVTGIVHIARAISPDSSHFIAASLTEDFSNVSAIDTPVPFSKSACGLKSKYAAWLIDVLTDIGCMEEDDIRIEDIGDEHREYICMNNGVIIPHADGYKHIPNLKYSPDGFEPYICSMRIQARYDTTGIYDCGLSPYICAINLESGEELWCVLGAHAHENPTTFNRVKLNRCGGMLSNKPMILTYLRSAHIVHDSLFTLEDTYLNTFGDTAHLYRTYVHRNVHTGTAIAMRDAPVDDSSSFSNIKCFPDGTICIREMYHETRYDPWKYRVGLTQNGFKLTECLFNNKSTHLSAEIVPIGWAGNVALVIVEYDRIEKANNGFTVHIFAGWEWRRRKYAVLGHAFETEF